MRIGIVIVASVVSGCGSVATQPSAGAIARIETGLALREDMSVVGVGDSRGMNRAARTTVRNVRCASPEPDRADCAYEARRVASPGAWEARRRTFAREDRVAPGAAHADGWVAADIAPAPSDARPGPPATLMDLGLWDPPEEPPVRLPDIPPPPASGDETGDG